MIRHRIHLAVLLALAACKKGGAPSAGLELVYTGAGLTAGDAATVNKRLGALDVHGAASLEEGKLRVRVDGSQAEAVKHSLATGGKLEFFGVDDSTSKRLCVAPHADEVTLGKELLRDGSATCYLVGEPAAVRRAAEPVLGANLRLQKLPGGKMRSFGVYPPPFLTGASLVQATGVTAPSPGVSLTFDEAGKQALADHSEKLVDLRMAIVFDDLVQSAPTVLEQISGGKALISTPGPEEAKAIAAVLQAGALPALQLQSERSY